MTMSRNEKDEVINKLKRSMDSAGAVFVSNLVGISANEANSIRAKIREADGEIVVAKNTLFRIAAKGGPYEKLLSDLKGNNAVAFAKQDAPAVAKILFDAKKENEVVELKGGVLDDKELSDKDLEALAKLPSKDQMLATLLATFMAPVSSFVRLLDAINKQKEEKAE